MDSLKSSFSRSNIIKILMTNRQNAITTNSTLVPLAIIDSSIKQEIASIGFWSY